MIDLVGTPTVLSKARDALKSRSFAYCGPDQLSDGTDVHDALDRLLDALRSIPPFSSSRQVRIPVNPNDVYVAGLAIERGHWLRTELMANGFELADYLPPKKGSYH